MSARDIYIASHRFVHEDIAAPGHWESARLMPATTKTGLAASINTGRVHVINSAALVVGDGPTRLAVRWVCGGGSVNARPAAAVEAACDWCEVLGHIHEGAGVYRCYDLNDELVYIGSSVNIRQRIRGHVSSTPWWSEVARVESEPHPSETAARLAEALAIRTELPKRNRFNIPLHVIQGGVA